MRAGAVAAPGAAAASLVVAWLTLAVVALALSTVWAVVLVAARTPLLAAALPFAGVFPTALALHVNLAALIWFLCVGAALWNAAAGAVWRPLRWAAFGLAAAGVGAVAVSPLAGGAGVHAANYVPVLDNPAFLIGLAWFVVAVLASALVALPGLVDGKAAPPQGEAGGGRRLVGAAALPLLLAAASAGWSVAGVPPQMSPGLYYELVTWGPGHLLQFGFTALMLVAWARLAGTAGIATPATGRVAAWSVGLVVAPAFAGLALHGVYGADTVAFRKGFTLLMAYAGWPGVLPLFVHLAWRSVRARPAAAAPGRGALVLSMLLFAVGCALGAFIRTDNTMIPAHYHGTVGAVTLALMALTLDLLRAAGFAPRRSRAAALQPGVYGVGLLLLVAGLAWAGGHGAPRKMPLEGAPLGNAMLQAAHALAGAGGALAIAGAGVFVGVALGGLGRRGAAPPLGDGAMATPAGGAPPPARADARPRALAMTLGGIAFFGLLIGYAPGDWSPRAALDGLLARQRAVDAASHVVERRRSELDARFAQGVAMLHAGHFDHAVTAFHRVLELDPRMPEAHVNIGFALLGLGDARAARDFFESATELRREQINAYYGMAVAMEALGDLPGAIGAMRTFVHRAAPDDPYQRKAQAALWEWEDQMRRERSGGAGRDGVRPGAAAKPS